VAPWCGTTLASLRDLLGEDAGHLELINVPVPAALIETLHDGFKEIDGCIVPTDFSQSSIWSSKRPRIDNRDDETGFECSLSKVHIDAYATECTEPLAMTRIAISYGLLVKEALVHSAVPGDIRIIVSTQLPSPELEDVGLVCTVRFHRIRPNQVWLLDDIKDTALRH
jgi:hypothetical protein